jgi:GNAT superfamily N-acetyltransferase
MNDTDRSKIALFPGLRVADARLDAPPPEGKLEMVITYLQMHRPPVRRHVSHRANATAIIRARRPTLSFYRYLYGTVGAAWMWYERLQMSDEALARVIQDEAVAVYVLYLDGVPAGYAELDSRVPDEVELAYFGLIPEFIGRGLGQYFLDWAVDRAWASEPRRLWVHTCNFDHPGAIAVYQKAGFSPYLQERQIIDDPRRG